MHINEQTKKRTILQVSNIFRLGSSIVSLLELDCCALDSKNSEGMGRYYYRADEETRQFYVREPY